VHWRCIHSRLFNHSSLVLSEDVYCYVLWALRRQGRDDGP